MEAKIKVIVVGCGNMGSAHARSYFELPGFELAGLVDSDARNREPLADALNSVRQFDDMDTALAAVKPQAAAICTYPESHADLSIKALNAGCHVFVEKPLAHNVAMASEVVETARALRKKVVVGYILRVHPSWKRFIETAQTLGKPLVMRMNLNQQSHGKTWQTHLRLMDSMSPIVDCGVHYIDVMCQMTKSKPVSVHAIGARLTEEIKPDMYNYGQLQVRFADGSVGWYEAGWGPMVSETAFFVKDVVGPGGSVSIMDANSGADSDNIDAHTKTNKLRVHHAALNPDGSFASPDEIIDLTDEPSHQELCDREQTFFENAIRKDLPLDDHLQDAINSLRIVLAADTSFRTGKTVPL